MPLCSDFSISFLSYFPEFENDMPRDRLYDPLA